MLFSSFFSLSLFWFLVRCGCADGAGKVWATITVDLGGNGNFTSVQAAINWVPDGNRDWVKIHLNKGVYREKVYIGPAKEHILLEGEGTKDTRIEYDNHALLSIIPVTFQPESTRSSSTFAVYASHFVARGIEFRNTYNIGTQNRRTMAVAATVGADMASFYDCSFTGSQDTLYDYEGRHYFNNCWIEGSVDFIFGLGQSIYESCTIYAIPPDNHGTWGYITAQGRNDPAKPGGFVFKHAHVTGNGTSYLGRAWGPYATVIFYRSLEDSIVAPVGWDSWTGSANPDRLTFAEVQCSGDGVKKAQRARFAKTLSPKELDGYLSIKFIDVEGWLLQQPE